MRHFLVSIQHEVKTKESWFATTTINKVTPFIVKKNKLPTFKEGNRIGINNNLVNPVCIAISEISPEAEYTNIKVVTL